VRRVYAEKAVCLSIKRPNRRVFRHRPGQGSCDKAAALEAFRQLGEVVGDALGNALTLVDGLAVIGGVYQGRAFIPAALTAELNSMYTDPKGNKFRRLASHAFNLEDSAQLKKFWLRDAFVTVPGGKRKCNTSAPARRRGCRGLAPASSGVGATLCLAETRSKERAAK